MGDKLETTEIAKIGIRLTDETYAAWAEAEDESGRALRAWFDRPLHDERYYVYLAALEREEAATLDLQRLAEITDVCGDVLTDSRAEDRRATP